MRTQLQAEFAQLQAIKADIDRLSPRMLAEDIMRETVSNRDQSAVVEPTGAEQHGHGSMGKSGREELPLSVTFKQPRTQGMQRVEYGSDILADAASIALLRKQKRTSDDSPI